MNNKSRHSSVKDSMIEFVFHVFIGFCLFVVIAIPAILLDIFLSRLEAQGVGNVVTNILEIVKYYVLIVDSILLIIFVFWAAYRFVVSLKWSL